MSNKKLLSALLFLISLSIGKAQTANGMLFKKNGDSLNATFVIPIFHGEIMNPLEFQNKPQIFINGNKFDIDLKLYVEAKFVFADRQYTFRSISQVRNGITYRKMKHLIQDGDIQLYRNYFPTAFMSGAVGSDFFLVDAKDRNIPLRPLTFKKKLLKFFNGCPRFADLVRKRKFKYKQLEEVIAQIEICCQPEN